MVEQKVTDEQVARMREMRSGGLFYQKMAQLLYLGILM